MSSIIQDTSTSPDLKKHITRRRRRRHWICRGSGDVEEHRDGSPMSLALSIYIYIRKNNIYICIYVYYITICVQESAIRQNGFSS